MSPSNPSTCVLTRSIAIPSGLYRRILAPGTAGSRHRDDLKHACTSAHGHARGLTALKCFAMQQRLPRGQHKSPEVVAHGRLALAVADSEETVPHPDRHPLLFDSNVLDAAEPCPCGEHTKAVEERLRLPRHEARETYREGRAAGIPGANEDSLHTSPQDRLDLPLHLRESLAFDEHERTAVDSNLAA